MKLSLIHTAPPDLLLEEELLLENFLSDIYDKAVGWMKAGKEIGKEHVMPKVRSAQEMVQKFKQKVTDFNNDPRVQKAKEIADWITSKKLAANWQDRLANAGRFFSFYVIIAFSSLVTGAGAGIITPLIAALVIHFIYKKGLTMMPSE